MENTDGHPQSMLAEADGNWTLLFAVTAGAQDCSLSESIKLFLHCSFGLMTKQNQQLQAEWLHFKCFWNKD